MIDNRIVQCKCCNRLSSECFIKDGLCITCYEYNKQLKQQLAEKDKEINSLIADYEKRISQEQELMSNMEHRLTEKDEELRKYKSYKTDDERIKDLTNLYSQYKEENNQLKKELKDKDFALECKERDIKAIERQRDKAYDDYGYLDKISRELGLQNVDYEKQIALLKSSEKCLTERIKNRTQLAIQELEKVKDTLKHFCDIHSDEYYGVKAQVKGIEQDVCESIDNQIKILKGE